MSLSPPDHPRRCGEHILPRLVVTGVSGSSPQMRGAPIFLLSHGLHDRIIPADAGSTSPEFWGHCDIWDHPRRCGEHSRECVPIWDNQGSSPQMRGALGVCQSHVGLGRIIPADAGSTC